MRAPILALPLALLALAPAARGAEPPAPGLPDERQWRQAQELARQGLEKLRHSLDALLDAVPQYGAPYLDDDGSIVIPRRRPPAATPVPKEAPLRS